VRWRWRCEGGNRRGRGGRCFEARDVGRWKRGEEEARSGASSLTSAPKEGSGRCPSGREEKTRTRKRWISTSLQSSKEARARNSWLKRERAASVDLDAKNKILMKISMGKGRRRKGKLMVGGGEAKRVGRGEGGKASVVAQAKNSRQRRFQKLHGSGVLRNRPTIRPER